jgi:hypothetical protein
MRNVSETVSAPIFQVKIRVLLGSIEGANPNPWTGYAMAHVVGCRPFTAEALVCSPCQSIWDL